MTVDCAAVGQRRTMLTEVLIRVSDGTLAELFTLNLYNSPRKAKDFFQNVLSSQNKS